MPDALARAGYGRAVETADDGFLHIEGNDGRTMCGEPVAAYTLHWDTRTVIACGLCLIEAGVPLSSGPEAAPRNTVTSTNQMHFPGSKLPLGATGPEEGDA